ncbi:MAG: SDR family NAD(P)-dependent oxidoreductase [Congregibacter sp.]
MPSPQQPVGSSFGHGSTATEVLSGADLSGKLAVVTGGYSGLGLETTRALLAAGADVVVPARRVAQAKQVLEGAIGRGGSLEIDELDLADLDSVNNFASRFLNSGREIDLLINNAAVMACPETRIGNGWECQFATNHLGHFALANRLYPALAKRPGTRVISLSSVGHKLSAIRWDDLMFDSDDYNKWLAYGQAKTANALFALGLDARAQNDGIRAFSVHPGGIMTPLQRHLPMEEMVAMGWIDEAGNTHATFKTPEQGASTTVWAATSPLLDGLGGLYCEDCEVASPTDKTSDMARFQGVNSHAVDPDEADKLWALSAELTGVDAFAA